MTAQIKRKASVKKEAPATKHYRLRLREWMIFWILVAFTMILIVTIFGDVEMEALTGTGASNTDQEVAGLKYQINEANATIARLESLQNERADKNLPCSSDQLNPPNSYIKYTQDGISVTLPYNIVWSGAGCVLIPVDPITNSGYISFGPYVGSEGGMERDGRFTVAQKLTVNEVEQQIKSRNNPEDIISGLKQRIVSGMTVFSFKATFQIGGIENNWYAVGRNGVYRITSRGWLTDAEAIKIIQSLRVTK